MQDNSNQLTGQQNECVSVLDKINEDVNEVMVSGVKHLCESVYKNTESVSILVDHLSDYCNKNEDDLSSDIVLALTNQIKENVSNLEAVVQSRHF